MRGEGGGGLQRPSSQASVLSSHVLCPGFSGQSATQCIRKELQAHVNSSTRLQHRQQQQRSRRAPSYTRASLLQAVKAGVRAQDHEAKKQSSRAELVERTRLLCERGCGHRGAMEKRQSRVSAVVRSPIAIGPKRSRMSWLCEPSPKKGGGGGGKCRGSWKLPCCCFRAVSIKHDERTTARTFF